jgi:hypothetical protein
MRIQRMIVSTCAIAILLMSVSLRVRAQSTSPWIKITDDSPAALPAGSLMNPSVGDAYLTVQFVDAGVFQKSNWWTNLVEKNRVGTANTALSGTINGRNVDDARASKPIELRKNNSLVGFGFAPIVIEMFPTTYSKLELRVNIAKSSQDGLADLLSALADISNSTPSLQVSQSTMGIVNGSKALADFLFKKQLIKTHAQSVMQFPATGNSLPAGLYVSLAGDSAADYAPITDNPANLHWNGAALKFNGAGLESMKLSYYIVRVRYDRRVFTDPLASLSLSSKPWVALYLVANGKVSLIVPGTDLQALRVEVIHNLINANTLLDADPDYIQAEKDELKDAVLAKINALLNQKRPGAAPFSVPADTLGRRILLEELQKKNEKPK